MNGIPVQIQNETNVKTLRHLLLKCHIDSVMVSIVTSSSINRGFQPMSGQTKDYEMAICCFSAKHAQLRAKID